jgi:hypothetical protein
MPPFPTFPVLTTERVRLREIVPADAPDLLNRIEVQTDAANVRSIRMLRGLGFWREGTFHEHFFEDGQFHDVALFALLRRDRVGHIAGADQPGNILVTRRS